MKTTIHKRIIINILIAVSSLWHTACQKESTPIPVNTTARYNMYMTDAPANYQQVNVNITGAQVHSAAGWVSLTMVPGIYNLLSLSNGKTVLLASDTVATGNVSEVRLFIGEGNSVMVDNNLYPLQTTSELQSELTVSVNAPVLANQVNGITLDFDAGMSAVKNGSGYLLKPVIRPIIPPDNGIIEGVISPSNSLTAVMAISGSFDSTSSFSSTASGGFGVNALGTGNYTVIIMPQPPYANQTFNNISVVSGRATNMGKITLQ